MADEIDYLILRSDFGKQLIGCLHFLSSRFLNGSSKIRKGFSSLEQGVDKGQPLADIEQVAVASAEILDIAVLPAFVNLVPEFLVNKNFYLLPVTTLRYLPKAYLISPMYFSARLFLPSRDRLLFFARSSGNTFPSLAFL